MVLRPLTFAERTRAAMHAVSAARPRAALARHVLRLATVTSASEPPREPLEPREGRGGGEDPPPPAREQVDEATLEILALYLAGADARGLPPYAELALDVCRATGWDLERLGLGREGAGS